jgi:hypothetical protein
MSKCEHNRQCRSRCKDCLGNSVNKNKCSRCKKQFIPDITKLQTCYDCIKPTCIHDNKNKSSCKECNKLIKELNKCEHNKRKTRCGECGGSELCIIHKTFCCKICRTGREFCVHDKIKTEYLECLPNKACNNCKLNIMSRNKTFRPYCFQCYCVLNPDIEIKYRYVVFH